MRQLIINVFILFLLAIIIWLTIDFSYQKKLKTLETEKNNYQNELTKKALPTLTSADASFIAERNKALAPIIKSPLFYSVKTQKLNLNKWKITIKLEGAIEGAADAADLKLDLPEKLTISDLKIGPAFPLFPRKIITTKYLLVTGVISTYQNQVVFGQPNKVFVEFVAEATDKLNRRQIIVNKDGTKIYLNGESVLDVNKSVSQIDLQ